MLAAPTPSISWLPSISSPLRPANADAVAIVSARETSAMPNAAPTRSGMSEPLTCGTVNGGKPCGSAPTSLTPCSSSWNAEAARIDTTTAARTLGTLGHSR